MRSDGLRVCQRIYGWLHIISASFNLLHHKGKNGSDQKIVFEQKLGALELNLKMQGV